MAFKDYINMKRLEKQMDEKTYSIAKALDVLLDNNLITFDEAEKIIKKY
tara:strand:- start:3155 stop:3301 length:147 start_codon:yes stop_codon:yes gene_type:complete